MTREDSGVNGQRFGFRGEQAVRQGNECAECRETNVSFTHKCMVCSFGAAGNSHTALREAAHNRESSVLPLNHFSLRPSHRRRQQPYSCRKCTKDVAILEADSPFSLLVVYGSTFSSRNSGKLDHAAADVPSGSDEYVRHLAVHYIDDKVWGPAEGEGQSRPTDLEPSTDEELGERVSMGRASCRCLHSRLSSSIVFWKPRMRSKL